MGKRIKNVRVFVNNKEVTFVGGIDFGFANDKDGVKSFVQLPMTPAGKMKLKQIQKPVFKIGGIN